ncbi:tripartite tricarboxylate transporter TctB family protein [Actinomadura madurae]|uniref:Tripartite tricarboxylate transporter TctB family protein n=1 Tax=Actinomadura madurae TaxID=1993 RepID=A0A1I5F599_9ACTN|nr:tripartite tricarboxylate transporter TctB family protein [Actinomadura madurae]SFO18978.1 Tripartite tricarboxylate transporter TctB family protein [Actinomadura madurae]SPT60227.1 Tripartite tricarboxylate transporter TctB family [Actinomadura madurae]
MRAASDVIVAGSLLALGVLYGVLAVGEGIGTMADTGAGFFPLVVAVVLVAASGTVLVQSRRGTSGTEPAEDDATPEDGDEGGKDDAVRWARVGGVLAAALLVPAVGATVGMTVTLSVSVALAAKIMGLSRWTGAAILGVAFGAATWLVFVRLLYVPLPAGTLGLV